MKSLAALRFRSAALVAATILLTGAPTLLAAAAGSLPRSALPGVRTVDSVQRMVMPTVEVEALRAEDTEREHAGAAVPLRFATSLPVDVTPYNSGTWETLQDGSHLWRLRIESPGAMSLNIGLEHFDLPAGASFWIHDEDGAHVQGPYTAKNRNIDGGLWTAVVLGDKLVAELHLPMGMEADLRITSVNHGYRVFGEGEAAGSEKRGSCNVNVVCPVGNPWRDQIRSVARITISGMFLCTGQMVNNSSQDETPYLLTAQHCIEQPFQAPSIVAYWNYETSTCTERFGGSLSQNQSGSRWIASYQLGGGSDFTLVDLDQLPDPSFNVYYSGWDARDEVPDAATAIHHPGGDQKSISFDYDPLTITSYLGTASPGNGTHLRVEDWDLGTTEGGSSGGCLFDNATGFCVGTLSGGFAACGNDEPDWYGRFARHWTGDDTPETRLSDWLDPLDTGVLFLEGKNSTQSESAAVWLIPAAASLPGVGSSNWKSEISVVNTGSIARNVSLYFVPGGGVWPGELLTGPFAVRPNESLYLNDPLLSENPTAGLLYASVTGDGTVAFSRTYTLSKGGGTFGQGVPGIRLTDAALATDLVLPMVHSSPGRFRTNVGFAQTSAGWFSVYVSIYSADGELLAEKKYRIETAWRQIDDIFKKLGIGDLTVEGGWIRIRLAAGAPAFWTTYATVIDDNTNDPTYILPVAP